MLLCVAWFNQVLLLFTIRYLSTAVYEAQFGAARGGTALVPAHITWPPGPYTGYSFFL